ncbi:30S ribosomal protein S19e [Candidatus Woesearchaeota archaeon]|nr:30S ribosomal protein S19e [Candidatus Woesearchaeota archaeon]
MTHIQVIKAEELINQAAAELKKQSLVQPLDWSKFVKTGHHKERLPDNPDWWFYRAAAILKSVHKLGPVGTQKLRTKYGGRKRRGHKPSHFYQASGSIVRKILQQLEKSELIKQEAHGVHKGRVLTKKGISFLDKLAVQIAKNKNN